MKFLILFALALIGTASACKFTEKFLDAAYEQLERAAQGKRQYILGSAPNFSVNKDSVSLSLKFMAD